jgi:parvulin-like peptidyl-prolyl isomerase
MITTIRKSFKSSSYKFAIWITIFALAGVFSIPQLVREFSSNAWIAKVNNSTIAYSDFVLRTQVQEARIHMLRQEYGQLADMLLQSFGLSSDPKVFALESLIKDALINDVADKINIRISPTFIAEKLSSPGFVQQELSDLVPMFVFDPYKGFNTQALRSYLQRMRMSMSDLELRIDQLLERMVVMEILRSALYVPEFVLKDHYSAEYAAKRYSFMNFKFDDYKAQAQKNPANIEQLNVFYQEQNKASKRYWVYEQRAGKLWTFTPDSYGIALDADTIESYYNQHKKTDFIENEAQIQVRHILLQTATSAEADLRALQEKAQQIRQELIQDPAQFAKKAQELSADAESAKQGGLIPFFARATHKNKVFDRAAWLLEKDGDVSEPIITDEGAEIIQRVAKKPATYKSLTTVKKDIETILLAKKFKEQFAHDVQELTQTQSPDKEYLATILRHSSKPTLLELTEKADTPQSQAVFRVKKEGDYAFYIADDKGYLVQVTTIQERYLPTLQAIKDVVERDWYEDQATVMLNNDLKKARELAQETSFTELKNMFKTSLDHTEFIKKGTEAQKYLEKKGLPAEKMFELARVGAVAQASAGRDGYLIRVDEVEPFNEQEFVSKRKDVFQQMRVLYARMLAESFVASLSRNATITLHESLLNAEK